MKPFLRPWRAQSKHTAITARDDFDELVIGEGDAVLLHVEAMGPRRLWLRVGALVINVTPRRDGKTRVRIERDGEGEIVVDGPLEEPAKKRAPKRSRGRKAP